MNDDPQVPDVPEPVEPLSQATDASQPAELPGDQPGALPALPVGDQAAQLPDEAAAAAAAGTSAGADPTAGEDYVSELRQSLASEEQTTRKSGGLIRRITGSLRRTTGELRRKTRPIAEPESSPPAEPPIPAEIGDDFLVDRLAGAEVSDPILLPPSLGGDAEIWAALEAEAMASAPYPDAEPPEAAEQSAAQLQLEAGLLDESLAVGGGETVGGAETAGGDETPDWISEIRQGTGEQAIPPAAGTRPEPDEPAQAPAEKSRVRGSRPLRAMITGLLRLGEKRDKLPTGDEVPDEMVTGRLQRSLGQDSAPDKAAPADSAGPETAQAETQAAAAAGTESFDEQFDETRLFGARPELGVPDDDDDEDETFLEELRSRLGTIEVEDSPPASGPEITPEDEALIWGADTESAQDATIPMEGLTFTPQDVWGDEEEAQPADVQAGHWAPISDDMYAAAFLTGQEIVPEATPYSQDRLLHEALQKAPGPEEEVSVDDLRATALEDYQDVDEESLAPRMEDYVSPLLKEQPVPEEFPGGLSEEEEGLEGTTESPFWQRLHLEGVLKKVLIVEAALVVVALLVAIPFFIFMIARGPVYQVGSLLPDPLLPNPLPANMPHPTGVQLPGGWYFPLRKSTFVDGHWKPAAAEWLEGTELRRVVALPWNPQTEAVINSFNPGDQVLLKMSNNHNLAYTVSKIERVAQSETQVLLDPSPSLVIVLYQENAEERWVVFAKP